MLDSLWQALSTVSYGDLFRFGFEAITLILGGLAAYIAFLFRAKEKKRQKDEKREMSEFVIDKVKNTTETSMSIIQRRIYDRLVELRVRSNADFVSVGLFHNGGKFLDGSSVKRFSIVNESRSDGELMDQSHFQNSLVASYWEMIVLIKHNDSAILEVSKLESSLLKSQKQARGVNYFSVLPIRNSDLIIGFVIVDWKDPDNTPSTPQAIEAFAKTFTVIRGILEVEMLKLGDNQTK